MMDQEASNVRLDEYTRLEMEDIMRRAVAALGGTFDQEKFNQYWEEAQERRWKRDLS